MQKNLVKNMKKYCLLALFCVVIVSSFAQKNPWYPEEDTAKKRTGIGDFFHSETPSSKSFMVAYGYALDGFKPAMFRFGYEWKHWAGNIDIFRSSFRTTWGIDEQTKTKGYYVMSGFGASGRLYSGEMGRGAFVELGASAQNPKIKIAYNAVNGQDSIRYDKWKVQHVSWGAGYRFGAKPRGLFVEVAYLGYTTLNQVLLFTDVQRPIPVNNAAIIEHAWFLKKYRVSTQFLGGIGYSF